MEKITKYSMERASVEAVGLWALASAQYPANNVLISNIVMDKIVETVTAFSVNARRAMEVLDEDEKFPLNKRRWVWKPKNNEKIISDLRNALNRIIHAKNIKVCGGRLPDNLSDISADAGVIFYIMAETNQRQIECIDLFALANAFLYQVLPKLSEIEQKNTGMGEHKMW